MIRLRFQGLADMIDIDFALVEPAVLGADGAGEDTAQVVGNDMDTTLPQLEARVLFNWGALQMEFNGGWVEFEDTQIVGGAERSYDIDAWIVALWSQVRPWVPSASRATSTPARRLFFWSALR